MANKLCGFQLFGSFHTKKHYWWTVELFFSFFLTVCRIFPHLAVCLCDTAHSLTVLSVPFPFPCLFFFPDATTLPLCNVWKLTTGYSVVHGKLKMVIYYITVSATFIVSISGGIKRGNTQVYTHTNTVRLHREWQNYTVPLNHVSRSWWSPGAGLVLIALCAGWMMHSRCDRLLLAFTREASALLRADTFYDCMMSSAVNIGSTCLCNVYGLNT